MSELLNAALRYAEFGYRVFPCAPGRKTPLTENGFQDATTDAEQIHSWWERHPSANIGIATEGLLVVDVDGVNNRWLADEAERALDLAVAPLSLTANGGRQYIFRQPAGKTYRNTTGKLAERVDTRADGGYVVVPPSALDEDKRYRWAEGMELDVAPDGLPEPPEWLVTELDRLVVDATPRITPSDENPIPSGQRNSTLASLAGTMRRAGMAQREIVAAITQANASRCEPPLPQAEVDAIAASITRYQPDEVSVALAENHWDQMFGAGKTKSEVQFNAITSRELAETEYELSYLVDGLLVRGQPGVIAGPKKTLKTNISIDLALSLSDAGLFLGRFNVNESVRVGLMSGESGAATIQETAKRIASAKFRQLEDFNNVVWSFDIPQLGNVSHTAALRRFINDHELEVLILDPTYLMMMGLGNDAGNLFIVGSLLKSLGELAQETGCTPLLCHHLKKSVADPYEPAELENIAWAGFQEFVRQWILLNRRVRYDPDWGGHHELWMSVGGSAGHSGLWAVNVDEGTRQDAGGRGWDVDVIGAAEAYTERAEAKDAVRAERKQQQEQTRHEKDRAAVLDVFARFPNGETKNTLREAVGFSGNRFGPIVAELLAEGLIEECEVVKTNRQGYAGYRATQSHSDTLGHSRTVRVSECQSHTLGQAPI